MTEQTCPKCGAPMVLKMARRGPNAGRPFYSCSHYPRCKGTRDAEPVSGEVGPGPIAPTEAAPRRIPGTPDSSQMQPVILECTALPRQAVETVASNVVPLAITRALSQWQIDLPLRQASSSQPDNSWLGVVEKILRRGRVVTLAPQLEDVLRHLAVASDPQQEDQWADVLSEAAQQGRVAPAWRDGFDSGEERMFYETVLPALGLGASRGWMLRQVFLDSLLARPPEEATNRRIDFVFAHPGGLNVAIEIDGAQHEATTDADGTRDDELVNAGYYVVRIPAAEVRGGRGPAIDTLRELMGGLSISQTTTPLVRFAHLTRRAQQIQVALLQALAMRTIAPHGEGPIRVAVTLGKGLVEMVSTEAFLDAVLEDCNALVSDIAALYGADGGPVRFERHDACDVHIAFSEDAVTGNTPTLRIRDIYLPVTVASETSGWTAGRPALADRAVCERMLTRLFGFASFREGQYEAVERCLLGKDAIVLLPTGAGKSVAYQLAAMLRPGVAIVVDPILSLMDDQIENLRATGIDRCCQITGAIHYAVRGETLGLLAKGEHLFCYVAPERFQDQKFRESLRVLTTHATVSLMVIDEAHCVSEWGHDFRPSYLNLARTGRDYCGTDGCPPPIMALTGTASRLVLKDVQRELGITDYDAIITPKSFDRPELRFRVVRCPSEEKRLKLRGVLESLPRQFGQSSGQFFVPRGRHTASGLVFCLHVNGDWGVVQISEELSRALQQPVPYYSGGAPKGERDATWDMSKRQTASKFKRNQVAVMACTKAFGMGIDKPNVRYTIHYGLPASIESFYQEAGRAGRDGHPAHCLILCSNDHPDRTREFLDPSRDVAEIKSDIESLDWDENDDISRTLYFHVQSFGGSEADYQQVLSVMEKIGDLSEARSVQMRFADDDKLWRERAIHRLLTIGVVTDYTVDHSAKRFTLSLSGHGNAQIADRLCSHIGAYQRDRARNTSERVRKHMALPHPEFVKQAVHELIGFLYEVLERSRRHATSEMLALCEQDADEASMRNRILRYLGTSAFTAGVEEVIDAPGGGLGSALAVLEEIRSAIDAGHIRGESGRALESYPDHPGLRLLRAVSEAMASRPDATTVTENLEACMAFAQKQYGLPFPALCDVLLVAIRLVVQARPALAAEMLRTVLTAATDRRGAARKALAELPAGLAEVAVPALVSIVATQVSELLKE